jgi:hypothetical protein
MALVIVTSTYSVSFRLLPLLPHHLVAFDDRFAFFMLDISKATKLVNVEDTSAHFLVLQSHSSWSDITKSTFFTDL